MASVRRGVKRPFRDAPDWLRCGAAVQLPDKSMAQCGRHYNQSFARNPAAGGAAHLCTQHVEMVLAGKPVKLFREGYPLAKMRAQVLRESEQQ